MRRAPPSLLALLALVLSCGASGPDPAAKAAADKAAAEAAAKQAEADKKKAEREAKRKAEEEAETQRKARLDELAQMPAAYPKKLDKACAAMVDAYDRYMQTVLEGDQLTKWKTGGKDMQTTVFKRECMKFTPEIAACQAQAFAKATPDLKDQIADFMALCGKKFGTKAG